MYHEAGTGTNACLTGSNQRPGDSHFYWPSRWGQVSSADADLLKLLIKPLYGDRAEIGIRELVQNSVDAVNELEAYCIRHQIDRTAFARPAQDADVLVALVLDDVRPQLIVADSGIGMTAGTIKDYFLCAGASFRRSDFWRKEFADRDGHATVLTSGRFGIGALAAFLLGSSIKVTSRHIAQSEGVQFEASLDCEAIQIERWHCPVGTTISIDLYRENIKKLVGDGATISIALLKEGIKKLVGYDILQSLRDFHRDSWDWYCLDAPRVRRMILCRGISHHGSAHKGQEDTATIQIEGYEYHLLEDLRQRFTLPGEKAGLGTGWNRIVCPEYEDIQWTYQSAPNLVCNGIRVSDNYWSNLESWIGTGLDCPNLSIFDPDGYLPLALARGRLATDALPFREALLESVVQDFLSYCLVYAPEAPIWSPGCSRDGQIRYPGCEKRKALESPHWLQTQRGLALLNAWNIHQSGITCVLCHDFQNDVSPPRWLSLFQDHPQVTFTTSNLNANIRGAFFGWNCCRVGSGCNEVACDGTRFLLPANTAKHWSTIGRLSADFKRKVVIEWETSDWAIWRRGKCQESDLLPQIAGMAQPSNSDSEVIAAEKYIRKCNTQSETAISKAWRTIMGSPVIPYDMKERREVLGNAFDQLKEYVGKWEEKRDQEVTKKRIEADAS